MASIKLPDGSIKELPDGTTVGQLAESIGKRLAQAAIVGKVDGKLVDLSHPLTGSHEVSIITDRDPDGLFVMRHSTAHVLAQALSPPVRQGCPVHHRAGHRERVLLRLRAAQGVFHGGFAQGRAGDAEDH